MENLDLADDDLCLLNDIIQELSEKYECQIISDNGTKNQIENFLLELKLSNFPYSFQIYNILKIEDNNVFYLILLIIDFGTTFRRGSGMQDNGRSLQVLGFTNTKNLMGNTLLRPKGKIDKLVDFFAKTSIKFEDTLFDDRYYVVWEDNQVVLNSFNEKFLMAVEECDGISMFINKDKLIVGFLDQAYSEGNLNSLISIFKSMSFINSQ
jgi:hypothetical protein